MVMCDANYCFVMSDFGKFGSNNNSGILAHSEIGNAFENKKLRIHEGSEFEEFGELRYYLLP